MQITTKNLNLLYLLLASAILSLVMLHSNELWTMESRWATVSWLMLRNNDYLHPYLFNGLYYDKPLLSYWLIVGFAKIFGHLNEWALRLPSALAGITSVYCVYRMGKFLFNEKIGIITGWLLTTTYFFIVWTRTSSADMLNVSGILLSLTWYFEHRENTSFTDYLVFFSILALTSLCKGLEGFIVPVLGVIIDLTLNCRWQKHLNWKSVTAAIIACGIYFAPFIASTLTISTHSLQSSGIYEVFSENIRRYFAPFDHENPWYTYFVYLPFYLLPWTVLFFFAVKLYAKKWRFLQYYQRWLFIFVITIFMFFSLSGSRRGYYILPLVPFALLMIADWIYLSIELKPEHKKYRKLFKNSVLSMYLLLFVFFAIVQPTINYFSFGAKKLAAQVNKEIIAISQLTNRNILLLNGKDNSLIFYLDIPKSVSVTTVDVPKLTYVIKNSLKINELPIIIASRQDLPVLQSGILKNDKYRIIAPPGNRAKNDVVVLPLVLTKKSNFLLN